MKINVCSFLKNQLYRPYFKRLIEMSQYDKYFCVLFYKNFHYLIVFFVIIIRLVLPYL